MAPTTTTLASFHDLPLDILPQIFRNLPRNDNLAACCLTSKSFNTFATPLLYQWVYVFSWMRDGKERILSVLNTLGASPALAKYVRILELREFPRWEAGSEKQMWFSDITTKALQQCVNLQTCIFTRDGALNSDVIRALQTGCANSLQELEINGRTSPYFDARLLLGFSKLQRISIIMPDAPLLSMLLEWVQISGHSLKHLSLICKASHLVQDSMLKELGESMPNLEHFHLIGADRVTQEGVMQVITRTPNLQTLAIEGLSHTFDMTIFAAGLDNQPALHQLTTLSINFPSQNADQFFTSLATLLFNSPLEAFTMWTPGGQLQSNAHLPLQFVTDLTSTHGRRLKKFGMQRIVMDLDVIEVICRTCPNLEQLFIGLAKIDEVLLGDYLSRLTHLQSLYVSYHPTVHNPLLTQHTHRVIALVKRCSSTLRQVGFLTRVVEIRREWIVQTRDEDGRIIWDPEPRISLAPYRGAQIPEPFLVMKA